MSGFTKNFRTRFAPSVAVVSLALMAAPHSRADPPSLVRATLGYTYYNRPSATPAEHDAAVVACAAEAKNVRSVDTQTHISGIVAGFMASAYDRSAFAASLENCMVVRGWRVVRLPDAQGEDLSKLGAPDLASRLAPWVGADVPPGEIVRIWGNEASNSAVIRFATRTDHTNDGFLSLKAATGEPLGSLELPDQPKIKFPKFDQSWSMRELKPNQFADVSPEVAVIVVRLTGWSMKNGAGFTFARVGADKDKFPSMADHAPDHVLFMSFNGSPKDGKFLAIEVPPGRWRIASIGSFPNLGFCLGSPSFDVGRGEVVYAGSFDLGGPDIEPDLSLDKPKAWLAGQSASTAMRPAVYINGTQGPCGDNGMFGFGYNSIYALEFKGLPYEDGYHWGGATSAKPNSGDKPQPVSAGR